MFLVFFGFFFSADNASNIKRSETKRDVGKSVQESRRKKKVKSNHAEITREKPRRLAAMPVNVDG